MAAPAIRGRLVAYTNISDTIVSDLSEMDIKQIAAKVTGGRSFPFSTFSDVTDQLGRGQIYPFAGRMISRRDIDGEL